MMFKPGDQSASVNLMDPLPCRYASFLFGVSYGFGEAFVYAKQVATFAAGIVYPREALPSAGLAAQFLCRYTPETHCGIRQKRKLIPPLHQAALP
jgi:hypothetical protein